MQDCRHGRVSLPVAGRWPAVREKLRGRDVYGVLVNLAKRRVAEVIDEGFKEAFVPCAVLKVIPNSGSECNSRLLAVDDFV